MIYRLYEYLITRGLTVFPREICFMLSDADILSDTGKAEQVLAWTKEFPAIEKIIFHISTDDPGKIEELLRPASLGEKTKVSVSTPGHDMAYGSGKPEILIALGKKGREEITDAIIKIAKEEIEPDDITEDMIEQHLVFQVNPDFVIKTGGNHLTDFLIWQSVYSELFFTDINWGSFRKVDYLRALRDYQARGRRFGT
ncbi:Ditrans,polycis-undecaprenyl-diphosphate synthase ((2E,6E)-farnesyl-diphosphate specific) [bioreactor metagenome]|uniref:Ditrans,polycis-undecaprenyl-diphosphate synthase ((2E,6E)-farnesyl-diphosphate specific) n=1 Tax=bioreactor metagenome TaxID=1076179 RepID=A0A644UG47_9ZZZZ|nr:undecaprenyl diphosphate synthase family protein [Methanocorpusculum sp.]